MRDERDNQLPGDELPDWMRDLRDEQTGESGAPSGGGSDEEFPLPDFNWMQASNFDDAPTATPDSFGFTAELHWRQSPAAQPEPEPPAADRAQESNILPEDLPAWLTSISPDASSDETLRIPRTQPLNPPPNMVEPKASEASLHWLTSFQAPDVAEETPISQFEAHQREQGEKPNHSNWLMDTDLDDASPLLSNVELGLPTPEPIRKTGEYASLKADFADELDENFMSVLDLEPKIPPLEEPPAFVGDADDWPTQIHEMSDAAPAATMDEFDLDVNFMAQMNAALEPDEPDEGSETHNPFQDLDRDLLNFEEPPDLAAVLDTENAPAVGTGKLRMPDSMLDELFSAANDPRYATDAPMPQPDDANALGWLQEAAPSAARPATGNLNDDRVDWFAEDKPSQPAWLEEIDANDYIPEEPKPQTKQFEQKRGATGPLRDIDPVDVSGLKDIDRLLDTYQFDISSLPQTSSLASASQVDDDFDEPDTQFRKLTEPLPSLSLEEAFQPVSEATLIQPNADVPDWLKRAGATVDQLSAAAIVRKQIEEEEPLEDLPGPLQTLHETGVKLPPAKDEATTPILQKVLGNMGNLLPQIPAAAPTKAADAFENAVSAEQRQRMDMLAELTGISQKVRPGSLTDEELDEELGKEVEQTPLAPRRRLKLGRLLLSLFLALAVILPFVVQVARIGNLPPAAFAAGSRNGRAFNQVNALAPGDLVLIGAEYGPTGSAELDGSLEALFRHIFSKGMRVVVVSSNPTGLLHARALLERLSADAGFLAAIGRTDLLANRDYVVASYLAGGAISLRAFVEAPSLSLSQDMDGAASNLSSSDLRRIRLVALVTERAEDVRTWVEQVAPLSHRPLLVAVSQSAAPLTEPYVAAGSLNSLPIGGLLVGYADAYTYRAQLDAQIIANIPNIVQSTPEASVAEGTTAPADAATLAPLLAGGSAPTSVLAVVRSNGKANVRSGPATTFDVMTSLPASSEVTVVAVNQGGDWLQVLLDDGRLGWVASSVVTLNAADVTQLPSTDATFTPTPLVNATPDAAQAVSGTEATVQTLEVTPSAPVGTAVPPSVTPPAYQNERWYGMTLGLLAVIISIFLGLCIHLIRGLFRRGKQS